jgi:hypothetical protein
MAQTPQWENLKRQLYSSQHQPLIGRILRYILLCLCKRNSADIEDWTAKSDQRLDSDFWVNATHKDSGISMLDNLVIYNFFDFVFSSVLGRLRGPPMSRYHLDQTWDLRKFCTSVAFLAFRLPDEMVESEIRWPLLTPDTATEDTKLLRCLQNSPFGLQEGLDMSLSRISVPLLQEFRNILYVVTRIEI